MGLVPTLFFVVIALGMLAGQRKWAMAFFLIGCTYMTTGAGLVILGMNLPVFRLLLLVGILRSLTSKRPPGRGLTAMDKLMIAWCAWVMFASFFHEWTQGTGPKYMAGLMFDVLGFYLLVVSFCKTVDDLYDLFGILCWILAPIAVFMLIEQFAHRNVFSVFGGVPEIPLFRNGRFRAQGPFGHAILAGTVGAGCIPLALSTWHRGKIRAIVGVVSCLIMVGASASSGPVMSTMFVIFALVLWKKKPLVGFMVRTAIPLYIALSFVMEKPPYYLIARIDLTGASTGWHRSYLIDQTINHFGEWWLFGTDRTVHWMPSQGRTSEAHTDITNQYIAYGVNGGFLSLLIVLTLFWKAFRTAGRLARNEQLSVPNRFLFWCIGSCLFAHAASMMSVAYFRQSVFFLWLPVAVLASFVDVENFDEPTELERQSEEPGPVSETFASP